MATVRIGSIVYETPKLATKGDVKAYWKGIEQRRYAIENELWDRLLNERDARLKTDNWRIVPSVHYLPYQNLTRMVLAGEDDCTGVPMYRRETCRYFTCPEGCKLSAEIYRKPYLYMRRKTIKGTPCFVGQCAECLAVLWTFQRSPELDVPIYRTP